MSENFDLATLQNNAVTTTEEAFEILEETSAFTPNIRFCTATSNAVTEGKAAMNHYALFKDGEVTDLGAEIDVAVLARRAKAIDFSDREAITTSYDMKIVDGKPTGEFARIIAASKGKDSGCAYGSEYLVVLEDGVIATLHFGSQTARNDSKLMSAQLGKFATLKVKLIKTKTRKYNSMAPMACSDIFDLPSADKVVKEIEKFNNPVDEIAEKVEAEDAGTGRDL